MSTSASAAVAGPLPSRDPLVVGRPEHAGTNALLNAHLARRGPLVIAHRGTGIASIVENTRAAARASLASGADVVEIDLTESADGAWFAFHDGEEPRLLGISENLRLLTAAQIRELEYVHVARPGRTARVEGLLEVLVSLAPTPGADLAPLVNLDRSWTAWPRLLPALDELGMTGQILLKSPAPLREQLDVLRAHPVKHPYLPICRSPQEVEEITRDRDLNVVGVELLTPTLDHPFADPAYIAALHARGLCVLLNAERLANDKRLFGDHDDELAVLCGPEQGWGPLLDLGADLVQTDWPWLLSAFRDGRRRPGR
ncbi:glycerophosphodiester phosphodiesterase family protein [Brachybacterium hainanense]|uniref:Glycerophosphodiester phosphodiesterase family protein n=1 Tax=Brachybacterium hainanense TaxID=1541174 RepID=A0ABV6R8K7_9MICO